MQKSHKRELLDLGPKNYSLKEYKHCLYQLEKIGLWLGGDSATLKAFSSLKKAPCSILDVGCGLGAFTLRLAQKYPQAKVLGIDLNPDAIGEALKNKRVYEKKSGFSLTNLDFQVKKFEELKKNQSFDVVTSTLFCHHLNDKELIGFLKKATDRSESAVIINDLQRSSRAYCLFWLISFLFKNRLIRSDGLLSIKRSLIKEEWISRLKRAEINHYSVEKRRGFRFIVKILRKV